MNMLKLSWILSILILLVAYYVSGSLPNELQLPIHWNIDGKADRYADAANVILSLPIILMVLLLILFNLKHIDPRKENILTSQKAISAISLSLTLLFLLMEIAYIAIVNGIDVPMMLYITFSLGILFLITGNYLSKTRSNFFIGIRTPWTLSSDFVWKKTHELGSKLFMFAGLIISVSCWFVSKDSLGVLILVTILPASLIPALYSWWLWKQENIG